MYNELPHTGIGAAVLTVVALAIAAAGAVAKWIANRW
ncbi:MAG: LPXTG cell wall anchor domain-containing protein [Acidimicrobiales bacterium]